MTATNNIHALKPSDMTAALETMIAAQIPTFLWGEPGTAKSAVVRQVSDSHGMTLIDVRAVQMDPVDLRGVPSVTKGETTWNTPAFLPKSGRGVLFLDELNSAPALVQAACYQLILDRRLGDYELPEGWTVIAAGNKETDRGVTTRMPTPLANRFAHFESAVDVDDWSRWAAANDVRPEVIAFIRFRPELLHTFDAKSGERAFGTMRSWERVSDAMKKNPPASIEFAVYTSLVGQANAAEFVGFMRIFRSLPSLDAILMNPTTTDVPTDPSTLYAISAALASRAADDTIDRIFQYADRMPDEFTVLTMADCARRCPDIQHSAAFVTFASNYSGFTV